MRSVPPLENRDARHRGLRQTRLPQNDNRKPSWIWRLGKAEVKASGVLAWIIRQVSS
jgi:hypothetical protein